MPLLTKGLMATTLVSMVTLPTLATAESGQIVHDTEYYDEKIAAANADRVEVEHAIADALTELDGVELALAASRLSATGANPLSEQVRKNHHVSWSGDIYVIQRPYWFLFDKRGLSSPCMGPPGVMTPMCRLSSPVPESMHKASIAQPTRWMSHPPSPPSSV